MGWRRIALGLDGEDSAGSFKRSLVEHGKVGKGSHEMTGRRMGCIVAHSG